MTFHLLSIFPDIFESYLKEGMIKRAIDKKIITIKSHNLRHWTKDKHQSVDDTPYGGGAGMLMKIEPIYKALEDIKKSNKKIAKQKRAVILLAANGQSWNQSLVKKYSKYKELIFICGRYEGVDARIEKFINAKISIGDYVLTGGELPALVMIDSISRLLPGVLGNQASHKDESYSETGVLEYPQYTKPEVFNTKGKNYKVPAVLLSGNHQKIKEWREQNKKIKK